ncbi:MAG: 4'-phosphopantetheinyl transferase superfamily protein [Bacteroidetes bacterium]|nr:MAG: 4'-phosphopantetheinyl transferase superfamily protein [Bacteroidota bacterium]
MKFVILAHLAALHLHSMPLVLNKNIAPDGYLGVWHATEKADDLISRLTLDPDDLRLLATIRNPNRKLQWLGCRMVLSGLLQTPEVGIRYTEYGKPLLVSGNGHISFSHSGHLAAAIWSPVSRAGIDLEQVREKINRVADRFLTPRELTLASGPDRIEVLTLFWAVKETLYKINGKPDLDIQQDLSIESFDYLCATQGELSARIRGSGEPVSVPVSYERMNGFILAWATVPENF